MFCRNRGDEVLPAQLDGIATTSSGIQNLYASATRDEQAGQVILKVVNPGDTMQNVQVNLAGVKNVSPEAAELVLAGNTDDENSMEQPEHISPVQSTIENAAANFSCDFQPHSLTVLRIRAF
jgi:alpha-N-arabinofuranosidase